MTKLTDYVKYLRGLTVPIVLLITATQLGTAAFLSLPFIYRIIYERLIPTYDKRLLVSVALGIIFVQILFSLFNIISVSLVAHVRGRLTATIRGELFSRVLRYPYRFFTANDTGALVQRLIPETDVVASVITAAIQGGTFVLQILLLLCAAFVFDAGFALICLVTGGCYIAWHGILRNPAAHFADGMEAHRQNLYEVAGEQIRTIRLIKLFNRYDPAVAELQSVNRSITGTSLRMAAVTSLLQVSSKLLDIAVLVILLYSMHRITSGGMVVGSFIVFSSFIWCFIQPVNFMIALGSDLRKGAVSARRIGELLNERPEPSGKEHFTGVTRDIVFRKVDFRYDAETPVLKNFSCTITAGSSVAFVGRSGSGKSSIVKLCAGLYPVSSGTLLIDGRPLDTFDVDSLRNGIGIMTQNTFLFNDTLACNIDPLKTLPAREMQSVLDRAGLGGCRHRLDDEAGENGCLLSGGERQRLALARLFAKKPGVLILDEATASLDRETGQIIVDSISAMKRNDPALTVIMITHSPEYLSHMDRVFFLVDGTLADSGSHRELLKRNSAYGEVLNARDYVEAA